MEQGSGAGVKAGGQLLRQWLSANKERFPTHAGFAAEIGCSTSWLSKILDGREPTDIVAIKIHKATEGQVPASAFRPDLWRLPEHVPVNLAGSRC